MKKLLCMTMTGCMLAVSSFSVVGCGPSPAAAPSIQGTPHSAHGSDAAKAEADKYKGGRPRGHGAR